MSANRQAKEVVVEEIKSKIQESKSVVLVHYSGLTVAQDTELRNEFRKNNVQYKVLKNTLVRKAFDELGVTAFDADLNGNTAVAFGADEVSAAKVVADGEKKYDGKISVKSGYVDNAYVDANGVKALASIPSKEQLYANLACGLMGVVRGLAVALNRVAEKMGGAQE